MGLVVSVSVSEVVWQTLVRRVAKGFQCCASEVREYETTSSTACLLGVCLLILA